ncbi:phoE Broad specificity phosphatase PhoE and related phosphatases [Caulobacteraceae bacterium]
MAVTVVFETHARSLDNDRGVAAGWAQGELSETGRAQAAELGLRRGRDGFDAVFASDLLRSAETARIAFPDGPPLFLDQRLRECDYGDLTGAPSEQVHGRRLDYLDTPYPGGESWRQATERVNRFLHEVVEQRAGGRVLIIGHIATRVAIEHRAGVGPLEALLVAPFAWQPGWQYRLD